MGAERRCAISVSVVALMLLQHGVRVRRQFRVDAVAPVVGVRRRRCVGRTAESDGARGVSVRIGARRHARGVIVVHGPSARRYVDGRWIVAWRVPLKFTELEIAVTDYHLYFIFSPYFSSIFRVIFLRNTQLI